MTNPSETFRRQHNDLIEVIGEMKPMLEPDALAVEARAVRTLLSRLAGKLLVHLSMEDESLYPRLLRHPDPEVASTAQMFMDEMGGIKSAFVAYTQKWSTAARIQRSPLQFVLETNEIFAALALRIEREDRVLYPLVDRSSL